MVSFHAWVLGVFGGGLVSCGGAGFSETSKVMGDERCLNQGADRNVSGFTLFALGGEAYMFGDVLLPSSGAFSIISKTVPCQWDLCLLFEHMFFLFGTCILFYFFTVLF